MESYCPYAENDCPKVNDLKEALDKVNVALSTLTKLVYIMTGIIAVQFGVMIY